MAAKAADEGYEPSYREQSVDEALDEHDRRITRLEKAGLVVLGYAIAEFPSTVSKLLGFL